MQNPPGGCRGAWGLVTSVFDVLAQVSQGGEATASLRPAAPASVWEGTVAAAGRGAWQAGSSSELQK